MVRNLQPAEYGPRVGVALATGIAAVLARGNASKLLLLSVGAGLLVTVTTGYCPVNAALERAEDDVPRWRTLKTYRVEP
jgi:hypothetical protein